MQKEIQFYFDVQEILSDIDPNVLSYNKDEYWMVESTYEYIEFYSIKNELKNTLIALQLARGLHNGVYRKSSIIKDGISYRLPYLIHPLMVCRMLVDSHIPLEHDDLDILLASALCHDMIEDIDFPNHGKELYLNYHLDEKVYETVKYVSKRKNFTKEEEIAHFHEIESHVLALLVKLSDRGNNVEDLYNMKIWKVHEYVEETNRYILPMCDYAFKHYPELGHSIEILKDKIVTLTTTAQVLVDRYNLQEEEMLKKIDELRKENAQLRQTLKELWK